MKNAQHTAYEVASAVAGGAGLDIDAALDRAAALRRRTMNTTAAATAANVVAPSMPGSWLNLRE